MEIPAVELPPEFRAWVDRQVPGRAQYVASLLRDLAVDGLRSLPAAARRLPEGGARLISGIGLLGLLAHSYADDPERLPADAADTLREFDRATWGEILRRALALDGVDGARIGDSRASESYALRGDRLAAMDDPGRELVRLVVEPAAPRRQYAQLAAAVLGPGGVRVVRAPDGNGVALVRDDDWDPVEHFAEFAFRLFAERL